MVNFNLKHHPQHLTAKNNLKWNWTYILRYIEKRHFFCLNWWICEEMKGLRFDEPIFVKYLFEKITFFSISVSPSTWKKNCDPKKIDSWFKQTLDTLCISLQRFIFYCWIEDMTVLNFCIMFLFLFWASEQANSPFLFIFTCF